MKRQGSLDSCAANKDAIHRICPHKIALYDML